jgi:hypothetical protein
MMGRQINFFLTPEDLAAWEEKIRQSVPISLFEYRSESGKPEVLKFAAICNMGVSWLTIGLCNPDHLSDIHFKQVQSQSYRTLDLFRSPAIELSRCFYDGTKLRRGRLYYIRDYYSESGELVKRPSSFNEWAKSVFKITVKGLFRDPDLYAYIGKNALELRENGRLTFVE